MGSVGHFTQVGKNMTNCEKLFSQMAWAKTTKIGCGVQWCPSNPMTIVVCNYKAA